MLNIADYKDTTDAKEADFENLDDIAGGQEHRRITQARLEELKSARGGTLTLDNLEYGGRRPFPSTHSRHTGSSTSVRPGRGTTTGGRGGGNAGSGTGRPLSSAPRSVQRIIAAYTTDMHDRDRPLDPAVDPNRPYGYGGKGSNRGGYQGTSSRIHPLKPAVSNYTAPAGLGKAQPFKGRAFSTPRQPWPWPPVALMENAVAPSISSGAINVETKSADTRFNAASSRLSTASTQAPAPVLHGYATQGQRNIDTRSRTFGQPNASLIGMLDNVEAFMADARTKFQLGGKASVSKPEEVVGFGKTQGTLPKSDLQPASGVTKEKLALLDPAGLRPARQSPGKFTDGIPSSTGHSNASPTVATEVDLIGLGITGVDAMNVDELDAIPEVDNDAPKYEDLMDLSVPDIISHALVPESSQQEEMVSIPKSEAEMWNSISGFFKLKDAVGLDRFLQQIKPLLHTVEETAQPTNYAAEVKANTVEQLENLIGDRNLPIRSSASQTTPSVELGKSKWAAPSPMQYPVSGKALSKRLKAMDQNGVTDGRSISFDTFHNGTQRVVQKLTLATDRSTKALIADGLATVPVINPFPSTTVSSDKPVFNPLEATTDTLPVAEGPKPKLPTQDELLVGLMYPSARPSTAQTATTAPHRGSQDVDMSGIGTKRVDNPFAAPTKQSDTLGASSTKSSTSMSGLGGSKFADPSYKPPVTVSLALRPKPINKSSPKKPNASALSSKPNESIFGDARNICRDPDAVKKVSAAMRTYPAVQEKSAATKRRQAGAGFSGMMKDYEAAMARKASSNNG